MTEPGLALKYRPKDFRDLAGQTAVAMALFRMIHEGSVQDWKPRKVPQIPQVLLCTGTRGSGKTSTARLIGKALNCQAEGERPCSECESCQAIAEGTSLAVVEIDAASNGTVDQVHRLQELVSYSVSSPYRVVIVDEVHGMSGAGAEALLKLLEEPPERTVFVLCTTERGKVKDTIFSRCASGLFIFRRITPADIAARLQHICQREEITAEPALLAGLAERADGSLRDAVMLLDQVSRVGIKTWRSFEKLHGEEDFAPWLVAYMVTGDYPALFAVVDKVLSEIGDYRLITAKLVSCLRDVLVLQSGGQITAQGTALRFRQQIAGKTSSAQVVRIMSVFWDLRTKVRSDDPRSSLELAMIMGTSVLNPPAPVAAPSQPPASNGHNGNGHGSTITELRALRVP